MCLYRPRWRNGALISLHISLLVSHAPAGHNFQSKFSAENWRNPRTRLSRRHRHGRCLCRMSTSGNVSFNLTNSHRERPTADVTTKMLHIKCYRRAQASVHSVSSTGHSHRPTTPRHDCLPDFVQYDMPVFEPAVIRPRRKRTVCAELHLDTVHINT